METVHKQRSIMLLCSYFTTNSILLKWQFTEIGLFFVSFAAYALKTKYTILNIGKKLQEKNFRYNFPEIG